MKMNITVIAILVALCLGYFVSERNIGASEAFGGGTPGRYVMTIMDDSKSAYILDSQEGYLWVVHISRNIRAIQEGFTPTYVGQVRTLQK